MSFGDDSGTVGGAVRDLARDAVKAEHRMRRVADAARAFVLALDLHDAGIAGVDEDDVNQKLRLLLDTIRRETNERTVNGR